MTYSNKVNWTINADRCALLIHDMQPHYLGMLGPDRRRPLMRTVGAIARTYVDREIPVFASQVPPAHDVLERGLMSDMWGRGPTSGRDGLAPEIGLSAQEFRSVTKRSYSAFFANDLETLLRRLGRDELVIVGVFTSVGCYLSAVDAFARDIRTFLVADATADMNDADHEIGLAMAARTCARVVDASEVIEVVS